MKRYVSLDATKAWCMFLVLAIHVIGGMPAFPRTWWSSLLTLLTVTSVPLFFMVNGALLLNRPLDMRKWGRRLAALVALTSIWKLILLAFCVLFWDCDPGALTPRAVVEFLLGGPTPFGQLGYHWFLRTYIGVYALLPVVKHLYDGGRSAHLGLLLALLAVFSFGSDTLTMLAQPLDALLGTQGLASALSHLELFGPFNSNAAYLVYFVVGALLFRRLQASGDKAEGGSTRLLVRRAFLIGAACYLVLFLVNRYQVRYLGQDFGVAEKYTNLFTLGLSCALFCAFLGARYPRRVAALCTFVGRRTFGIYIIEAVPMRLIDLAVGGASTGSPIPDGSALPPVLAMAYLLAIVALAVLATAGAVAAMERVPLLRRLLPR